MLSRLRGVGKRHAEGASRQLAANGAFAIQLLVVSGVLLLELGEQPLDAGRVVPLATALAVTVAFFLAHLAGHAWARTGLLVVFAVLLALSLPEPFVTQHVPLVVILPAALALLLGGPLAVPLVGLLTWGVLFVRAGGQGVYADLSAFLFFLLAVGLLRFAGLTIVHEMRASEREHALRLRAELERDRAREQSAERARMFSVMAHEMGNVLTPMDLQAEILADTEGTFTAEDRRRARDTLRWSRERTRELVAEMSEYGKIEAGRVRLRPERVPAARLASQAVEAFKDVAAKERVALHLVVTADAEVETDPLRASQILTNLVSNAIKYSPPGGTVRVRVDAMPAAVRLAVEDTGVGLTPEQMGGLFKPFSQVHEATTLQKPGTGLGLYISKSLAEKLGGDIECRSEGPGRGAEFAVTLPRRIGPARETGSPA